MKIIGIIPARYASTRYPGKPLIDILGKSMIQRVYEKAKEAKGLSEVIIATDDERIAQHVREFGGVAVLTKEDHPSGTDRCYEALLNHGKEFDYVLNIQGDEPFIDPEQINELCAVCTGSTELATQMIPVDSHEILFDMGEVKIVMNTQQEALYFSRMVIPYIKGVPQTEWHKHHAYFRHVGMYAYRTDVLKELTQLAPSALENAESLEQLRWLENGYKIKLVQTTYDSHCIDTPEDLVRVLKHMGR
ncbi:MAG: 3-deoxy-manno-octulosonate cytidylyltransferase [Bacteroidetes bacterium B1(2017)]|nr:MAG: 3-deoxy-manno-octulosonate cytidylyltransferase [Bacteroidetes bacterium B1(2017)]